MLPLIVAMPFVPNAHLELLASDDREVLEAAVGALFSYVVVDMECRIRVAQERWGIHRLVYIMQAQTALTEVSRKVRPVDPLQGHHPLLGRDCGPFRSGCGAEGLGLGGQRAGLKDPARCR